MNADTCICGREKGKALWETAQVAASAMAIIGQTEEEPPSKQIQQVSLFQQPHITAADTRFAFFQTVQYDLLRASWGKRATLIYVRMQKTKVQKREL